VHIYQIVFSPDGQLVTAGQIHTALSVCDAQNGKLLHKLKRTKDEISGLEHAPSGELICSSWCGNVAVFDAKAGRALAPLTVSGPEDMVNAITLFAKGTRLAALCNGTVTIWSWPERKLVQEVKGFDRRGSYGLAVSRCGATLAVSEYNKGVHLLDWTNGKRFGLIPVKDLYKELAFTPDENHLIVNEHGANRISIWSVKNAAEVCQWRLNADAYEFEVSTDGAFLAAATDRGAFVWQLPPLLGRK
jgi:WD40 repeat protein